MRAKRSGPKSVEYEWSERKNPAKPVEKLAIADSVTVFYISPFPVSQSRA